jgi:hypothetical protein
MISTNLYLAKADYLFVLCNHFQKIALWGKFNILATHSCSFQAWLRRKPLMSLDISDTPTFRRTLWHAIEPSADKGAGLSTINTMPLLRHFSEITDMPLP